LRSLKKQIIARQHGLILSVEPWGSVNIFPN
jgi:hypothetical protein